MARRCKFYMGELLARSYARAYLGHIEKRIREWRFNEMDVLFLQTADQVKYKPVLELTSRTVVEYCSIHGFSYESFLGIYRGYHSWQATYNRIPLLRRIAESGFSGWVCYMDADAYIVDLHFDLRKYLSDKDEIAFIAATDRPGQPDREFWFVNAGVFFVNLGSRYGREIIYEWAEAFERITDRELEAARKWGDVLNDQDMLQRVLKGLSAPERAFLILYGEGNVINYHAKFIPQVLRHESTSFDERTEIIRAATNKVVELRRKFLSEGGQPAPCLLAD